MQLEEKKKNGEGLRNFGAGSEQTEVEAKYSEILSKIAEEHGVESVTTIALACKSLASTATFLSKPLLMGPFFPFLILSRRPLQSSLCLPHHRWPKGRAPPREHQGSDAKAHNRANCRHRICRQVRPRLPAQYDRPSSSYQRRQSRGSSRRRWSS